MRKERVRVPIEKRSELASRLKNGESLRSIAASWNVTYQALQYHRSVWGLAPLRASDIKGAAHPNWRGGMTIDKHGYRLVYSPERKKAHPYSYEHILVAEKMIGRRLRKSEHVHHINGLKLDNSESNLVVLDDKSHRTLHRQLETLALQLVRDGKIHYENGTYVFR